MYFLDIVKKTTMEVSRSRFAHWIAVALLGLVIAVGYRKLLFVKGFVGYNDAAFLYNAVDHVSTYFSTINNGYLGADQGNAMFLYVYPASAIYVLHNFFHLDLEIVSKLLTFGVLFLTTCCFYWLSHKVTRSPVLAFFGALAFLFTNQTLEYVQFGGFYYHFVSVNALLILLGITFDIVQKKTILPIQILLIALSTILLNHPFYVLIFSILYSIIVVFLAKNHLIKNWWLMGVPFVSMILFGLYWMIPFLINTTLTFDTSYADNGMAVYQGFKKIANPGNIFVYNTYFSQSARELSPSHFFNMIVPGFVLLSLLYTAFQKRNTYQNILLAAGIFFLSLSIIPSIPGISRIFEYLFQNVGIFAFFRSITRFSVVFVLAALLLALMAIQKMKPVAVAFCVAVAILAGTVSVSGDLKGTLNATDIPEDYYIARSLINKDGGNNTTIAYPNTPYEAFTWNTNRDQELFQQTFFFYDFFFDTPIITERASLHLVGKNSIFDTLFTQSLIRSDDYKLYNAALDDLEAKYVLVDKTKLKFGNQEAASWNIYTNFFDKNPHFTKIMDSQRIALYQRNDVARIKKPVYIWGKGMVHEYDISASSSIKIYRNFSKYYTFEMEGVSVDSCATITNKPNYFLVTFDTNCLKDKGVKKPTAVLFYSKLDVYVLGGSIIAAITLVFLLLAILRAIYLRKKLIF